MGLRNGLSSLARNPWRAVLALPFLAVPVGLFLIFFHVEILDPTNFGWLLRGDWGAHALGWHAFRHDDWRLPPGATNLLAWPTGVSVAFTDSDPLVSLLLKPFGRFLPSSFQFTGLWFLACLALHFALAFALVRRHAASYGKAVMAAVLLTALPTLYFRAGHATLFAHWLILWAFWVFAEVPDGRRRDGWFAAVLGVAALVHPYLLFMTAAIWGSDGLRRGAPLARARDWPGLGRLGRRLAAVLAAPLAGLWAGGMLIGRETGADGFGDYAMGLEGPINPVIPGYSLFLTAHPLSDSRATEGFQYLGAGLLLLLLAAAASLAWSRKDRRAVSAQRWALWLVPAMAVLWLLALSNAVQLYGREILRLPYDHLLGLTDALRGSGRLFWPVAYLLVLLALRLIAGRSGWRWGAVLAAAIAVQAIDLSGFARIQRANTARAAERVDFRVATDPAWNRLVRAAGIVEFQPPEPHLDEAVFYEVAWRAAAARRPVNIVYAARESPAQQRLQGAARAEFLAGRLRPDRLYVLPDGCSPPWPLRARVRRLDGVLVIPPDGAGIRLPPAVVVGDAVSLGAPLSFAAGAPGGRCLLSRGWSRPEAWGVWSDGAVARLGLLLPARPAGAVTATLMAMGFPEGQSVQVSANGRPVGTLDLAPGAPRPYALAIPAEAFEDGGLDLEFRIARPTSPQSQNLSADDRMLGLGMESLRLDAAAAP